MKSSEPDEMPYEERQRRFLEYLYSEECYRRVMRPSVPVVSVPVTEAVAEVAKANREGVTLVVRRSDGVSVVARPHANALGFGVTVTLVRELNEDGLPVEQVRA
jgi:hypothetical protein